MTLPSVSRWLVKLTGTCLIVANCGGFFATAEEPWHKSLVQLTAQSRFQQAHWGLLFTDLATGEVIYQKNAEQLFVPASTTKLYSVACALDALGAEHRFETPIRRRGEINARGELVGDLILVASGDLSLGGRTTDKDEIAFTNSDHTYANGSTEGQLTTPEPLAGLHELAKQVAAAGIRRVRGEVLVDDRLFEKNSGTGSGPSRLTPIMVNDNLVDFLIEPTADGQPARVTWRPQSAALQVDVQVETTDITKPLVTWIHELGPGRLHVHGQIPVGHKPVLRVYEVPDAAAWARSLLIEALQKVGVTVDAPIYAAKRDSQLPSRPEIAALPQVAKLVSPPFSESARLVLKVSHNLHASTLPLLVAAKHGQRTLTEGLHLQRDFLAKLGVEARTISFGGGAGGSRSDFVTPRATVQLLRAMSTRPDFATYYRAQPSLGVDGTLHSAVDANSPARAKVRAKTGTLMADNTLLGSSLLTSKALAGYLETKSGKTLAFAIFVNNVHLRDGITATSIGRDLGKLCEIVYENK